MTCRRSVEMSLHPPGDDFGYFLYNIYMSDLQIFKPWSSLASFGKELSLPGGKLFFYDCQNSNEQKPVIIFIHGLGDEADTWRHIMPLLCEKGYRCIAPDLPGFGRSLWKGRISVGSHADAVIRMMRECGVERRAVLAGSSMGCGVAELIAFKKPALVQALIMLDGCFPVNGAVSSGMILAGLPFAGKSWYRAFRKNHEAAWKSLYPYYHNLDAMSDEDKSFLRDRVIARVESDNQERGYFASLRSISAAFIFKRASFIRGIGKYRGKILMLWGEHDHVMPVRKASSFREQRPDAALKIITGSGHLPHQEKPEQTAREILSFLDEFNA